MNVEKLKALEHDYCEEHERKLSNKMLYENYQMKWIANECSPQTEIALVLYQVPMSSDCRLFSQ